MKWFVASLLLWNTAAISQVTPAPAPAQQKSGSSRAYDPNEVVCEKIEVLGSRLAVKRVCATRAEWAERRANDRLSVDRAQRTGNAGKGQ